MSNQYLKLRRSAIPGKIPETSSIDFGEIALNTYDGLAFIKKSGSSGEEIVTIGSGTSTNISGSNNFIPVFSGSNSLVTSSIYQSGSFTGIRDTSSLDPTNPDILLVQGAGVSTYNLISAHGNLDSFVQLNIQNFSATANASSDIVATNDASDGQFNYIDMGINSSQYTANIVGGPNDAYIYSTGNDLYIGNARANQKVVIFNGGYDVNVNAKIYIHPEGVMGINTNTFNEYNPAALTVYPASGITNTIIQSVSNIDGYSQISNVNASTGTNASSDIVAYNNIDPVTQSRGFVDIGINSTNFLDNTNYPGWTGSDAYVYTDSPRILLGSTSGSSEVNIFVGGVNPNTNSKLMLRSNNIHSMTGSLRVTGSITALSFTGSLLGTSSYAITASYWSGSILNSTSASYAATAALAPAYVLNSSTASMLTPYVLTSITSSMSVLSASFATTASYIQASGVVGLNLSQISLGVVTASVNTGTNLFNIVSGSNTLLNLSTTGNLGIGTTSPVYKLDVSGSVRIVEGLTIQNNSTSGLSVLDQYGITVFKAGFNGSKISIGGVPLGGFRQVSMVQNGGTTANGGIVFYSDNAETVSLGNIAVYGGQFRLTTTAADVTSQNALMADASNLYLGYYTYNTLPASAALAIQSTTKGFLPPRMTAAQRTAISTPAQGLLVYDLGSATEGLWLYNSGSTPGWQEVLTNTGSQSILGGLTATSFTGSLQGTASWATNAVSSSFASTASYWSGSILNATSASYASTAALAPNYVLNSSTSSMLLPYVLTSVTSSMTVLSASFAATTSLAPNYVLNSSTSSMLTPYVLTSVTASMLSPYVLSSNTASFITNSQTSSMSVLSSSFASTASSAENFTVRGTLTAQTLVVQTITSSVDFVTGSTRFGSASTSTHQFTGSVLITGSLVVNGSNAILTNQTSSMSVATASYVLNAVSASFASTASYWSGSILNATSASFASTASYILNAISASYASTASYVLASGVIGLNLSQISLGVVTASVNTAPNIFTIVSSSNTLVALDTAGNLGIGTTSPSYKLDVSGNARSQGNLYIGTSGHYLLADTNNFRIYDKNNAIILQAFPSGILNSEVYLQGSAIGKISLTQNNIGVYVSDSNVSNNNQESFIIKRGLFSNMFSTTRNVLLVTTQAYSNLSNATILRGIYVDVNDTTTFTGFTDVRAIESVRGGAYFNTTTVNASAILQADSTTKGFLPPRMTAAQRVAISTPAQGLLVYDSGSATEGLWLYNSGSTPGWQEVLTNTGSQSILGGLTATSFTGSLQGTASWATNAISASFASTASYSVTSSLPLRGVITGSVAGATLTFTKGDGTTFDLTVAQSGTVSTASYVTSSGVFGPYGANSIVTASYALTASYVANASSFPYTGSAIITGSLTVTGSTSVQSLNVGSSQFNNTSSITSAGTTIISQLATGSYTACFYNYTIASASNARSGQVMSVWNGATVKYTEVTTTDIGNTATASFAVALSGANIQLNFTAPGVWTVKNISNLL